VLQIQSNTHIDKKEKDEQRAANRRRYRVAIEPWRYRETTMKVIMIVLTVAIVLSQGCAQSSGPQDTDEATESLGLEAKTLSDEILDIQIEEGQKYRNAFSQSLIGSSYENLLGRYGHAILHANADPPDSPLVGHFYHADENESSSRWLNVWLYPNNDKIVDAYWIGYPGLGLPPSSKGH